MTHEVLLQTKFVFFKKNVCWIDIYFSKIVFPFIIYNQSALNVLANRIAYS